MPNGGFGEIYGYGWAYDLWASGFTSHDPNSDWKSEQIVDNEDTRNSLTRSRNRQRAVITRDRFLAQEDVLEAYDFHRIDAVLEYRTNTHQAFHDSTVEMASLHRDYQIEVATEQQDYRQSMSWAEVDHTVAVAQAKSQRIYGQVLAESQFALATAPAYTAWQIADATHSKTYETRAAANYQIRVSIWASLHNSRWAAFQLDLARAEIETVRARGDVGLERARQIWSANDLWLQATTAARLGYANELHGEGGAVIQRDQTIAAAHAANGANGAILTLVTAQANATHLHDVGVSAENWLFHDAIAMADAQRDRQVSAARHDLQRDYIRANYHLNKPDGISQSQWLELLEQADRRYLEKTAVANEDHANQVAENRRDWTNQVGELNVQFVTQIVAAQQDRANQVRQEMIVLATGVATAQREYSQQSAESWERQSLGLGAAEAANQIRNAQIEAQLAADTGSAERRQTLSRTRARTNYEVGQHADRVSATTDQEGQESTPWSLYRNRVALADHAWASAGASTRVLEQQATGIRQGLHLAMVGSANQTLAIRTAAIDNGWVTAKSAIERILAVSLATADANLFLDQEWAEANLLVATVNSQGQADTAYAQAIRDRDNAYADAGVLWVKEISRLRVELSLGEISSQQHTEWRNLADQKRQQSKAAADEIFLRATDEADSQQQQQLAAARSAYVDAAGMAKTNHTGATELAREVRAAASGQQEVHTARERAQAAAQQHSALSTADHGRLLTTGAIEQLALQRMRDIGTTQASVHAEAEATYHLAQATQTALDWQFTASTNLGNSQVLWQAARSTARATWFEELVIPYTTYQATSAQWAGQEVVDQAELRAARKQARSIASSRALELGQRQAGQRQIQEATLANTRVRTAVQSEGRLHLESAQAEWQLAKARVLADTRQQTASGQIERQHRANPSAQEAIDARAEAASQRDLAFADADFQWRLQTSQAETVFTLAQAAREQEALVTAARWERIFNSQSARSQSARDVALAIAEADSWIALAAVESLLPISSAETDFLSARYAAQVVAADDLVAGLPRVAGSWQGITIGFATGDVNFQANFWNGTADAGEFFVDGTELVGHDGSTLSLGNSRSGIGVDDGATDSGFVLWSEENVQVRFAQHGLPAENSEHLIAVRYADGQWQYNNDTPSWYPFTPVVSDWLIGALDFSQDTIESLGGQSRWAYFAKDHAAARAAAWETIRDDFLQWQADQQSAQISEAIQRGADYQRDTTTLASLTRAFQIETGIIQESVATEGALAERQFVVALVAETHQYRVQQAWAQQRLEAGRANPDCDSSCSLDLVQQSEDAQQAATEAYQSGYAQHQQTRRNQLARAGVRLALTTGNLNGQWATEAAQIESDHDWAQADATFEVDGSAGLTQTLAQQEYAYRILEGGQWAAAMASLANSNSSPWSVQAEAEAMAQLQQRVQPLALLGRIRRQAQALTSRSFFLDRSAVLLEQSVAQTHAHAVREQMLAQSRLVNLSAHSTDPQDISAPADLALPVSDLGTVTQIAASYTTTQPGSIADLWYEDTWRWMADYSNYWNEYGRYNWGWSWEQIIGPYGGFTYGGLWWYGNWAYGTAYGTHALGWGSGFPGWGGWSPSYVDPATTIVSPIDAQQQRDQYQQALDQWQTPAIATWAALALSENASPPAIDPATGDIVVADADARFRGVNANFSANHELTSTQLAFATEDQRKPITANLRPLSGHITDSSTQAFPNTGSPSTGPATSRPLTDIPLADDFQITTHGQQVVYLPVVGANYNPFTGSTDRYGEQVVLGVLDQMGWVRLTIEMGGGRTNLSALKKAASQWNSEERKQILTTLSGGDRNSALLTTTLGELIDAVRSPYQKDESSPNVGIFFDGTGSSLYSVSNVARLYNLFVGTKFFYAGVGNGVDSQFETIQGGIGGGFTGLIEQAEADILQWIHSVGSRKIQIFGFSRGAAQAIELAHWLDQHGIAVDFLGLYDPVYSIGSVSALFAPGQSSQYIEATAEGKAGNYVSRQLSANVGEVTVIYAMNESRAWFPATKLIAAAGSNTQITSIGSPGVHSDVGGHWGSNLKIQQLTLTTMLKDAGDAIFRSEGQLDAQLQAIFDSGYTVFLAMKNEGQTGRELVGQYKLWLKARNQWMPYAPNEYIVNVSSQSGWAPGPVGAENGTGIWSKNTFYFLENGQQIVSNGLLSLLHSNKQPSQDHLKRKLDWVTLGLWDTYGQVDSKYIQGLYDLIAHPKGGWRTSYTTPLQIEE